MPLPELLTKKEFTCATLAESANYFIRQGEAADIKELVKLASNEKLIFGRLNTSNFVWLL